MSRRHATVNDTCANRAREERPMNELCSKGARELAGMIASGEVTSSDVVEAYLARIDGGQPGPQRGDGDAGRRGARRCRRGRPRGRGGRAARAAGRRAVQRQGEHRRRRLGHHLGRRRHWPSRSPRPTRRWSPGSGRPAPSRSPAPTCRTSRSAGTPRVAGPATRAIPGTRPARRAVPPAARPSRWRPA